MTYATGNRIDATDYNTLATTFKNQWGTGTGNHGLGQSVSAVNNVATGATVTATQWTGLISGINSCLAHQGQAQITPSTVTVGNPITYYSAITTAGATVNNATGTTGLALIDGAVNAATYSASWGTTGNRGLVFTHNIAFASGDAARYFFNAGGVLKLSFAKSAAGSVRNAEWAALAAALGTIQIGASDYVKIGGSGVVANLQHDGYFGLTTTQVQKVLQYDGVGLYSSDYIACNLSAYGTPSNGGYPGITINSYWVNVWPNAFQPDVTGTTTTNLVVSSPSTTYLANTWGTPTVGTAVALY